MPPATVATSKSWNILCLAASKRLMNESFPHPANPSTAGSNGTPPSAAGPDDYAQLSELLCFETMQQDGTTKSSPTKQEQSDVGVVTADSTKKPPANNSKTKRRNKLVAPVRRNPTQAKNVQYVQGIPEVSKRDYQWNQMFKRLQEFKSTFGHCNVPQGFADDAELATWVKNQRQAYRYMLEKKTTKRISAERVARLNQIGFEWRKYVRAEDWKQAANNPEAAAAAAAAAQLPPPPPTFEMPSGNALPSADNAIPTAVDPLHCDEKLEL